jgi:hypothetical protein
VPPEAFRPTGWRVVFAVIVAIAAFFAPQEIPLEWYPLNNPGSDINYLEIKCAANTKSNVVVYLNLGRGINELDKISFPIGPSELTFTYTFPLWDAPIYEIRFDPLDSPGELLVENFRIINRRNEEIVRFTKDSFFNPHDLAAITPTKSGWKIVTIDKTNDPFVWVRLSPPIVPVDMNHRNFLRCVLSTSYLAMMLLFLLLAVFLAFYWPASWREFGRYLGYLALLGILFSFVGNRGLIRHSIQYARTQLRPASDAYTLEFDVNAPKRGTTQLFWDTGKGFNEGESLRVGTEDTPAMQTLRFPLPSSELHALRFDLPDQPSQLVFRRIRLVDGNGLVRATFSPEVLVAANQIASIERKREFVVPDDFVVTTTPDGTDPVLSVSETMVKAINAVRKGGPRPDRGEWPPAGATPAEGAPAAERPTSNVEPPPSK